MAELQDVINRLRKNHGIRDINRSTGVHRTIIRSLQDLSKQEGWLNKERDLPTEEQIASARKSDEAGMREHRFKIYHSDIKRWVDEGYSYIVMHRLLNERIPCSLSSVSRYVKRSFPQQVKAVMRRDTVPGQVMEVDFGYLGITYDPDSGRRRKTWVFSGRLRHSRRAWRERVFDQKQQTFFGCHMHAFEHFNGVPHRVVPDNLKAAVVRASFQDPIINRAYRKMAKHYGVLIDPCAPYSPRHKGGVENDIKYIKGNFWPIFREQQLQHGHEVPYADELEEQLALWSEETADRRVVGGVGRTPQEIFVTEEAEALESLPVERWDPLSWATPKVGPDWRVQFEKGFYSVPYRYIGEEVLVYGDSLRIRIYCGIKEITLHQRVERTWGKRIKDEHAPPHQLEYLRTGRSGLQKWAAQLGESVGEVAGAILADKVVDGMRPVRALIRLADTYSPSRLNTACRRALHYDTPTFQSVKQILLKGLDRLPLEQPVDLTGQIVFRFQREPDYFDPEAQLKSKEA